MAGASRAFEEREQHLRYWLSMEDSFWRVVLRRPVELTSVKLTSRMGGFGGELLRRD
jgi:hypothetical protein